MTKSDFSLMDDPDRMVFIAQLHHYMWYNNDCYNDVLALLKQWKEKETIQPAKLFPNDNKD